MATAASKISVPQTNIDAIDGLKPEPLWRQFAVLSSIPRPSKKEGEIIAYIKDFAKERGLTYKQDAVGNLAVFHPGAGNGRQAPPVVLQGHVDMVTEKNNDIVHDFEKDPILLRRIIKKSKMNDGSPKDELWLGATGTTLGSDNGIGVAATLALLETPTTTTTDEAGDGMDLPPLEALFTVDEETGLTGAMDLDAKALGLTGKTMLNLDTEEWQELYVGCAGGGESVLTLPLARATAVDGTNENSLVVQLRVEGLLGGHSGINIHEGRGNAVLLCAAAVQTALKQVDGLSLISLQGGDKHNAIPREASAQLLVQNKDAKSKLENVIATQLTAIKTEYGTLENKLNINLVDRETASSVCLDPLDKASTTKLLSMLLALPAGAIKYSHMIPELVETSNNVASITMTNDAATVLCSTRSSIPSALEGTRDRLAAVATLAGAEIERGDAYPGWNPNPNSQVLKLAKTMLTERMDGKAPGVKAIHAGLECGLLIEKMGGNVDALSFGPTITGAHSPDENVNVETVPPFFELVQDILSELAKKR